MKTQNYIDLGLPSGTLWASENVDSNFYTFDEAVAKFNQQLPTMAHFDELLDYTEHKWDDEKKGMVFTGKNGNSIFLPAAGYRYYDFLLYRGSYGDYWSSSLGTGYPSYAWSVYFGSGDVSRFCRSRYNGLSVRLIKTH